MLQFTLADFQFVHPTDTEIITKKRSTGMVGDDGKVIHDTIEETRRKRIASPGARVEIACKNSNGKDQQLGFDFDERGRAHCAVAQSQLPLSPMDAEYEVRYPTGRTDRGKVKVGGFEGVPVTEIVAA